MEDPHSTVAVGEIGNWSPLTDNIRLEPTSQGTDEMDSIASRQGHTNSTIQSYPDGSPRSQRSIPVCPVSHDSPNFDRLKVDEFRQVLNLNHQLRGIEETLTRPLVVSEESQVTKNNKTIINRIKIWGLWLAKKIYKDSDREQDDREIYLQEAEILKTLSRKPHWHVVLMLHNYIDLSGRGCLILSPLAQTTLADILSQRPNKETKMLAGTWFGCLVSGLTHIHAQMIKHKDIKPENILIHGTNAIIADMGISHGFVDDSKSWGPSAGSRIYKAPEAIDHECRGRRQDVWSMLCCFLEILAFLKDIDRKTFLKSMKEAVYYYNHDMVVGWLNSLKPGAVDEEELAFIQLLLDSFKINPEERSYARDLVDKIQGICKQWPYKYIGECCARDSAFHASSAPTPAVGATSSAVPNPEDLEKGSLLHFLASTEHCLSKSDIPEACPSLAALREQVSKGRVSSIRSAERKFLLIIAPKHCRDGKNYLDLCNGFIDTLSAAIQCGAYASCLYDTSLGEYNSPYTTNYFEILVREVSNRYLTHQWD